MTPEDFYEMFDDEEEPNDMKPYELEITPCMEKHFNTIKAHRFYQLSMCFYKQCRYADGKDIHD